MSENMQDGDERHFANQLTEMAVTHKVEAAEDIYSANGIKLLAKGAAINKSLYDKVVTHKLTKPLESSVQVENAPTGDALYLIAEKAFDSNPPLAKLASWKQDGETAVSIFKRLRFQPAASTLLSVHHARNEHVKLHCVQVALLAMGLLKKSQDVSIDQIQQMGMAGMFHDIGEVYIDPTLFTRGGRQLTPLEWKQIAAHPVVGEIILKRIEGFPASVSKMIFEHHERLDGFGYPKGTKGNDISLGGQVLGAAETLSGLLAKKTKPLAHAELAMKLIPGEYARNIIDLIAKARENVADESKENTTEQKNDLRLLVNNLYLQLSQVKEVTLQLVKDMVQYTSATRKVFDDIIQRYAQVQRGLSSTGLNMDDLDPESLLQLIEAEDPGIQFETTIIINEIRWRFFELSRITALHSVELPEKEMQALLSLAAALNGDSQKGQ